MSDYCVQGLILARFIVDQNEVNSKVGDLLETEDCKGRVKWFDARKGYGFVTGPNGEDVFVHFSQIHCEGFRTLKEGVTIHYELVRGDKGLYALNVKLVTPAAKIKATSNG